jgi:hypothetical protein
MQRGNYDTVTLWCKWRNPETHKDEYYRHILTRCSWEQSTIKAVSGTTANMASVFDVLIAPDVRYVDPIRYQSERDKTLVFSLRPGDIMALGEHDIEITGLTPLTESEVKNSLLPNVLVIKAVSINTQPYKHGKHYAVDGV